MTLLLLSGCLLLMDRPPKCPDRCPGNFQCEESTGICPSSCVMDGEQACLQGYHCDIYSEKCKVGEDTGYAFETGFRR